MASVVDAFNEALSEDLAYVKFVVYAIPVYCRKDGDVHFLGWYLRGAPSGTADSGYK